MLGSVQDFHRPFARYHIYSIWATPRPVLLNMLPSMEETRSPSEDEAKVESCHQFVGIRDSRPSNTGLRIAQAET